MRHARRCGDWRPRGRGREICTSTAPRGDDLGSDAESDFFRSSSANIQADGSMNPCDLLVGQTSLLKAYDPVLACLSAPNCPDVASRARERGLEGRFVELRIVRENGDVGPRVDAHPIQSFVWPGDNDLVHVRESLRSRETLASVHDR